MAEPNKEINFKPLCCESDHSKILDFLKNKDIQNLTEKYKYVIVKFSPETHEMDVLRSSPPTFMNRVRNRKTASMNKCNPLFNFLYVIMGILVFFILIILFDSFMKNCLFGVL